jgi:hypothetical protein
MRVSHAIDVHAPAEVVWSATVDVERWPEWTPTVKSVRRLDSGPLKPGSIVRIRQPMQPTADWVVTRVVEGQEFSWETRRGGLRMTATHRLVGEGSMTRNVLHVDARGAVAVLLWPLLRLATGLALSQENRGLKRWCEGRAGA